MTHSLHTCFDDDCFICQGELASCNVCGGGEASLPTECPGRRMTADEQDNVQAGNIDFRHGQFITLGGSA